MAYVNSRAQYREQRVVDLEVLANIVGQDIRPYLAYLVGLVGLLALPGTYVEDWVESSMPQCGLLQTTTTFTMHWQA